MHTSATPEARSEIPSKPFHGAMGKRGKASHGRSSASVGMRRLLSATRSLLPAALPNSQSEVLPGSKARGKSKGRLRARAVGGVQIRWKAQGARVQGSRGFVFFGLRAWRVHRGLLASFVERICARGQAPVSPASLAKVAKAGR